MQYVWLIVALIALWGFLSVAGSLGQIARAWNVYMASLITDDSKEEKNDG